MRVMRGGAKAPHTQNVADKRQFIIGSPKQSHRRWWK